MSDLLLETRREIVVPRAKIGEALVLDMTNVYIAEGRIAEVAFVTPHKAPELLAIFNVTFLELTRHITKLEYERNVAERIAGKMKAIILLDRVPQILKDRGLASAKSPAGSEDLREAILALDDEYQGAKDRVDQISAMIKLLQGKLKSIEMAYTSVKKIIGENAYSGNNPNLKHGSSIDETGFGTVSTWEAK